MDEALSRYLRSLTDSSIPVSLSDVEALLKEYPFFTLPAVSLIRSEGAALPEETRRKLLSAVALNAPDPVMLAMLTDKNCDVWLNFYPAEEKKKPDTYSAIDTFLSTYGHSSEKEDELLERLIFHPSADYSAILEREEQENPPQSPPADDDSQDALISSFILKHQGRTDLDHKEDSPDGQAAEEKARKEEHPVAVNHSADDSSLSESLAKIYVRRGRYDKAFEIIYNLSLNNPKKSIYFADQLRFLRKLMLNSQANQ